MVRRYYVHKPDNQISSGTSVLTRIIWSLACDCYAGTLMDMDEVNDAVLTLRSRALEEKRRTYNSHPIEIMVIKADSEGRYMWCIGSAMLMLEPVREAKGVL